MNAPLDRLAGASDATEIARSDAQPVNAKAQRSLYAKRQKIYPKRARGTFRRVKWIAMAALLAIYYLAPWLRWDRGPTLPDQAILIDFPSRRFYFFFIELWPEEVYYITGLLILAALGLFLVTSLAGRVWCGYACPQTVWTDLFIAVERFMEGDRNQRIKLDQSPFSLNKLARKLAKHAIWIVIALATGGAWVFYFADAPTLLGELAQFDAPAVAYLFIGLFAATTYVLGGIAREQVCTYMCPWPRIQAALQDEESLIVSYHPARGEPRGPHKKGESWDGRGHCVDCNQCVAVCPMGIDIRDGQQLECISCALCIDACNDVMDKVGLPHGLIGYDSLAGVTAGKADAKPRLHPIRPRTILYAVLILVVAAVMTTALLLRTQLGLTVERDRNPLFVTLSDGSIRNGYTVHVQNKHADARTFVLTIEGLPDARLSVLDAENDVAAELTVAPDQMESFRIFVAAPRASTEGEATDVRFRLRG
ncbi:MAG TPA: cytochrome c oxidase accessory protein CcoG, partial [Alphaproteobacteria bacterium]|nr:cytochrome c oxidase accessory protein CcoG [Alphaproteobacteria bacterium]